MITALRNHARQRVVAFGIIIALIAAVFLAGSVVVAQHARADVYTSVTNWGPEIFTVRGTNASVEPLYRAPKVGQTLGGQYTPGWHPARYYLPAGCDATMYVYNKGVEQGYQDHWVTGWHDLAWERANYIIINCT